MLFSSFMKVILRMFIEEPFTVDGLCKQVDIVVTLWHYHKMWGRSPITVTMSNRKKPKHFTKLAGASSPQAWCGWWWRCRDGAWWARPPAPPGCHLQPTNNPPVAAAGSPVIWCPESREHSETLRQPPVSTVIVHTSHQPALHTESSSQTDRGNYNGNRDQICLTRNWWNININNIMLTDCFFANIKMIKMRLSHWKEEKP